MDFPISLVLFAVDFLGGGWWVGVGISAIKPFGSNNMSSHGDLASRINGRILNVLDNNVRKRGLSLLSADLSAGMPPRRGISEREQRRTGCPVFDFGEETFFLSVSLSLSLSLSLSPTPSL